MTISTIRFTNLNDESNNEIVKFSLRGQTIETTTSTLKKINDVYGVDILNLSISQSDSNHKNSEKKAIPSSSSSSEATSSSGEEKESDVPEVALNGLPLKLDAKKFTYSIPVPVSQKSFERAVYFIDMNPNDFHALLDSVHEEKRFRSTTKEVTIKPRVVSSNRNNRESSGYVTSLLFYVVAAVLIAMVVTPIRRMLAEMD